MNYLDGDSTYFFGARGKLEGGCKKNHRIGGIVSDMSNNEVISGTYNEICWR